MKESLAKAAGWLSHHRSAVLWTVIAGVLLYVPSRVGLAGGQPESRAAGRSLDW